MIWDWAAARAESAASRAVVVSVVVLTELRSRRARARKAMAITRVTESMMSVMTSAMPRRAGAPAGRRSATTAGPAPGPRFFTARLQFIFMDKRPGQHWGSTPADE